MKIADVTNFSADFDRNEVMKMNKSKTRKIVMTSMFAAICCVATMVIKVPTPLNGYMNLGDSVVLLSGVMLSPLYAFLASGIGSSFADLFSGYVTYAAATFVIKGIMALIACFGYKLLKNKIGRFLSLFISAIMAELFMSVGYFVFEGFLYGFAASLVNIPANLIQGVAGLILGLLLAGIFEKHKIL